MITNQLPSWMIIRVSANQPTPRRDTTAAPDARLCAARAAGHIYLYGGNDTVRHDDLFLGEWWVQLVGQ